MVYDVYMAFSFLDWCIVCGSGLVSAILWFSVLLPVVPLWGVVEYHVGKPLWGHYT